MTWRFVSNRKERWINHILMIGLSTLLMRLVFPFVLVDLAIKVLDSHPWSILLLPEIQILPRWSHYVLAFIGLDLVMYWQHRVLHKLKFLWRLHLMHHTDRKLDASTGLRFHPLEISFSMAFKMLGVILIGPPAIMVIVYEIVLNGASLFTHANIRLNPQFERKLRWFIVTPTMHRIHHSDIPDEANSNFGFFFSCWDRMLGTYKPFSIMTDRKVVLGVETFREPEGQTFKGMLLQPFYSEKKRKKRPGVKKLIVPPST